MRNLKQHSRATVSKLLFGSLFLLAFAGCGEKEEPTDFLAKVNNRHLTLAELHASIDTAAANSSHRSEYIRQWVDEELLYQKAEKEGVTSEKAFEVKMVLTKRQLAVAVYLDRYFTDSYSEPSEEDLSMFYASMKDAFMLTGDAYVFNRISLNNEDGAILFRDRLFNDTWERVVKTFPKPSSILSVEESTFEYDFQISNYQIKKFLEGFASGEISMIFSSRPGEYTIIKLINKYKKNEIPPFSVISGMVKDLYKDAQRKILLKKLMDELYSSNDIEIK